MAKEDDHQPTHDRGLERRCMRWISQPKGSRSREVAKRSMEGGDDLRRSLKFLCGDSRTS